LFSSSCVLTFWRVAVSASIFFCSCAILASCFTTIDSISCTLRCSSTNVLGSLRNSFSNIAFTLVVAHAVRLPFFVAHQQVRIHHFHVLGHKAQLWCPCWINFLLVTKDNRLRAKSASLACSIGLICSLKPWGRCSRAQLAVCIDKYRSPRKEVAPKMLPM